MGRRKKSGIELKHKVFGIGTVVHRRTTDAGPALAVQFANTVRTILLDSDAWVSPADAEAVFQSAPEPPIAQPKPKKAIRLRGTDVGREIDQGHVAIAAEED